MRAFIEKFRQRFFLRPAYIHRFAINKLRDVRRLIVHVANQDRLRRTDDDARRLQAHIDAVRTEVTFLSRMILRIDEDSVVRTGGHAGFATDTDRFVKIDDAVRPFEHGGGRTSGNARRVRALVAARHLMRAPHLRENTHVNVRHVGAGDSYGHDVFRLARRRARMTADAAGVVDDLGPLNAVLASWLWLDHLFRISEAQARMPGLQKLRSKARE